MRRPLAFAVVGLLVTVATPLDGQQARSISAGMTTDEVRATFGAPSVVRETDGWTYFFYTNRCLPRCGTDDTVFFRDGQVVAAVLHAPSRRFSGPPAAQAISSAEASGSSAPRPAAAVSGLRVRTADGRDQAVNLGEIRGRPAATSAEVEAEAVDGEVMEVVVPITIPRQQTGATPPPAAAGPRAAPTTAVPASSSDRRQLREQGVTPNTLRER